MRCVAPPHTCTPPYTLPPPYAFALPTLVPHPTLLPRPTLLPHPTLVPHSTLLARCTLVPHPTPLPRHTILSRSTLVPHPTLFPRPTATPRLMQNVPFKMSNFGGWHRGDMHPPAGTPATLHSCPAPYLYQTLHFCPAPDAPERVPSLAKKNLGYQDLCSSPGAGHPEDSKSARVVSKFFSQSVDPKISPGLVAARGFSTKTATGKTKEDKRHEESL